jgi:hypothetical protein
MKHFIMPSRRAVQMLDGDGGCMYSFTQLIFPSSLLVLLLSILFCLHSIVTAHFHVTISLLRP